MYLLDTHQHFGFGPHSQLLEAGLLENSICYSHHKILSRNTASVCTKISSPLIPDLLFLGECFKSGKREESLWLGNYHILIRQMYTPLPDSAMVFCSPGLKLFFYPSSRTPKSNPSLCTMTAFPLPSSDLTFSN